MTEDEKIFKVEQLPKIKKRVQILALLSYFLGGLFSTQLAGGYGIICFIFIVVFTNLFSFIYWRLIDVCPWCHAPFTMNVTRPLRIFNESPSKVFKENGLAFSGERCVNCGSPYKI